jgi:hypothetical protein
MVGDALLAASSLDDYKATGNMTSLNFDKNGVARSPAELQHLVDTVKNNPKLSKYYDAVQKSYDDLARYRVDRGRDTIEAYNELRARRPNYVAMNRNLEPDNPFKVTSSRYSANADQGMGASRSVDEAGGVQGTTGVGNPFNALFDEWTNEIRRSDLNDLRADFLTRMHESGARTADGKFPLIQQLDAPPKGAVDEVHQVRINGKTQFFRVRDPAVNAALHMSPRATVPILEGLRQFKQSTITGTLASPFNLFAAAVSPVYDSTVAVLRRPKGTKIGLTNHLLVGGYTGAAKYMKDSMIGAMATTMRDHVIRGNTWLTKAIGLDKADALAGVFESAYRNTAKAEMDQLGITSHTMHSSPDPSLLSAGIEHVAPHFAAAQQAILRDDISRAALNGDLTPFKALLATSKSAYVTGRANRLARVYQNVIEALHNGARYTAYEANKGKNSELGIARLVSDMRRLSADASQHGSSDAANVVLGAITYANLGMQSLYEVAHRAKAEPLTFLTSALTLTGTLAAMHYTALATDPDALEKHLKKTPEQKALGLTSFAGIDIPVDPITRGISAVIFPILDHLSGLSKGKFDPNFMQVMDSWLDGETDPTEEATQEEMKIGIWQAIQANDPLTVTSGLSGLPVGDFALAAAGVDPGMSRMLGEPVAPREQALTGMEEGTSRPDAVFGKRMELMIASAFGSAGRGLLQIVDDVSRAYGKSSDLGLAFDVGVDRWRDNAAKKAGPLRPLLFGNYVNVQSAADVNNKLMDERQNGVDLAIKVLDKDYRGATKTSITSKYQEDIPPETGIVPPELQGTELLYISSMAKDLDSEMLSKNRDALNNISRQTEAYGSGYGVYKDPKTGKMVQQPREKTNISINDLNDEKRYQRMLMLTYTREYEEKISHRIGRPFTFKNFNPDDYVKPLAPSN